MKESGAHQEEGAHEHDRNPEEAGDQAEKHPHLPMKHTTVSNQEYGQAYSMRHASRFQHVTSRTGEVTRATAAHVPKMGTLMNAAMRPVRPNFISPFCI